MLIRLRSHDLVTTLRRIGRVNAVRTQVVGSTWCLRAPYNVTLPYGETALANIGYVHDWLSYLNAFRAVHSAAQPFINFDDHYDEVVEFCVGLDYIPRGLIRYGRSINGLGPKQFKELIQLGSTFCIDSHYIGHHLMVGLILYMRGEIDLEPFTPVAIPTRIRVAPEEGLDARLQREYHYDLRSGKTVRRASTRLDF